jgi:7-cyano-7-deazaguanine reductase
MSRSEKNLESIKLLGNTKTDYPADYDCSVLECFENVHPENDYVVSLYAYEFSSLCPKTKQPDFAKLYIKYIPNINMVESKSLKLYLFSFRNHGDFHEDCMNMIMKDLVKLMEPKYLEITGVFTPRGGISIIPFVNYSNGEAKYNQIRDSRILETLKDKIVPSIS